MSKRIHNDRLEPFARVAATLYEQFNERIRAMPDTDLAALRESCQWASQTNCWCMTYEAAQWMLPHIRHEQSVRTAKEIEAAAALGREVTS